MDYQTPFALVLSDIDHFRDLNDDYGTDCGDQVLVAVSDLLGSQVRKQDSVARWGGEEFLIVLPDTDREGAVVLAGKLRESIAEHIFTCSAQEIHITITSGVSVYRQEDSIDTLVCRADKAMIRGKRNGRNCVVSEDKL